jgi:hypothetical protein
MMDYFKEQLMTVPTGESGTIPDFSAGRIEQEKDIIAENEIPVFFAENENHVSKYYAEPSVLQYDEGLEKTFQYLSSIYETNADITNQANIREYGVSEGVAAVKEVFTPDVIRSWEDYSNEQRAELLDKFGKKISNALNIDEISTEFDVYEPRVLGYNNGDGSIHLRPEFTENPNLLIHAIDTIAHEIRHQFQSEAMENPEKYGIDEGTLKEWRMAQVYYDSADGYNPLSYQYNPLENDSQEYGRSIVRSFCRDFAELAYGAIYDDQMSRFA